MNKVIAWGVFDNVDLSLNIQTDETPNTDAEEVAGERNLNHVKGYAIVSLLRRITSLGLLIANWDKEGSHSSALNGITLKGVPNYVNSASIILGGLSIVLNTQKSMGNVFKVFSSGGHNLLSSVERKELEFKAVKMSFTFLIGLLAIANGTLNIVLQAQGEEEVPHSDIKESATLTGRVAVGMIGVRNLVDLVSNFNSFLVSNHNSSVINDLLKDPAEFLNEEEIPFVALAPLDYELDESDVLFLEECISKKLINNRTFETLDTVSTSLMVASILFLFLGLYGVLPLRSCVAAYFSISLIGQGLGFCVPYIKGPIEKKFQAEYSSSSTLTKLNSLIVLEEGTLNQPVRIAIGKMREKSLLRRNPVVEWDTTSVSSDVFRKILK